MSLFKRAVLYISRNKRRSIVLFFILVIIAILTLTGTAISHATDAAMTKLRQNLGGYFKVAVDYTKPAARQYVDDSLTKQILSIPGVTAYNGLDIYYLTTKGLMLSPGRFTGEGDSKAQLARFLGNTDTKLNEYFLTKTFTLTEGRHIESGETGKALVSETLAETNGLHIEDTVTAAITEDTAGVGAAAVGESFDMQIVGIFKITDPQATDPMTPECDILENFFFTDMDTTRSVLAALGQPEGRYHYGAVFTVDDPQNIAAILNQAQSLEGIKWDALKVTVNDKAYQTSMLPLQKLDGLTTMLVWVIIAFSVLLLSLILTMWMRDRVHEMGVYLSIGIGKLGIIGQFIAESMIIAVLAFCLSLGVSCAAANLVGNTALKNLTAQAEPVASTGLPPVTINDTLGLRNEAAEVQTMDIQVGAGEFFAVVGLGTLVIVISVGVSSILVIRMKPKDILSKIS